MPKGLISGTFNEGIEKNAFGHVSSLAGNNRNKSASFSCLGMGTRPLFHVFFHFPNFGLLNLKNVQANPCGFGRNNEKGPLNKCAMFNSIEIHGRGNDLKIKSVHFILAQSGTSIGFRPLSF